MNQAELIGLLYYSGMALVAALGLVLVQGVFLSLEGRFSRWMLAAVPLVLCVGVAVSTLLSGRNLKYEDVGIQSINSVEAGGGANIMRAVTAVVLALCFAKILVKLMNRRSADGVEAGGQMLIVTLLLFFASTLVLPAAFGAHPAFIHNSYYAIFVFIAFFLARAEGMGLALDSLKTGLLMLMLGSLAAAVAMPSLALQTDYSGWIPGLNLRLWGLGSHANSIGPLALLLGLLMYFRPYGRGWLNGMGWLSLLAVFVLAQSKTAWAAGATSALVLVLYGRSRDEFGRVKPTFILALLLLMLAVVCGVAFTDLDRISTNIAATEAGRGLTTLTGRTTIWTEALRTWQANFWFGYGPEAWGPLHRARIGMPFAYHAHNQLMQSLSSAGLFGGLTMLAYLLCMLVASIRAARCTRGVSIALALIMLARCMTEAPLELRGLLIGETIIHLAWFMLVLLPFARQGGVETPDMREAAGPAGAVVAPQVRSAATA